MCAYDRAGLSRSEPAETPRTTSDQVTDLHALLTASGIAPPYVFVGHSLGGWNVMVYAGKYPDEVVGAVLVDTRPPDASQRWLAALPAESADESEAIRGNRFEFTTFEHEPARNAEGLDIATSAQQAKAAAGLTSQPLVVLAVKDGSSFWEGLDVALAEELERIRTELEEQLAGLSTSGRLVWVQNSGHDIPREQPQAVVDAVLAVIAQLGE